MIRKERNREIDIQEIRIELGRTGLEASLALPESPAGLVLFAHGSGSGRHSPRNRFVAHVLNDMNLATCLLDLLTPDEEKVDDITAELRFDIPFLADRLEGAARWCRGHEKLGALGLGFFGASTGAAAALVTAASLPETKAVVSRGGRPDLAERALEKVFAPTLFIVGGDDVPVLELNQEAFRVLAAHEKRLEVVAGATHLFEEAGALDRVAELAGSWFSEYLPGQSRTRAAAV